MAFKRHTHPRSWLGESFEYFSAIRELNVYGLLPQYETMFREVIRKNIPVPIIREVNNPTHLTLCFDTRRRNSIRNIINEPPLRPIIQEDEEIEKIFKNIASILDMFCEPGGDDEAGP